MEERLGPASHDAGVERTTWPFIGRTDQLAELRAALVSGRSVAVTGAPGAGKTRFVDVALEGVGRAVHLETPLPPGDVRGAFRSLRARVASSAASGVPVLVVDDAHGLDPDATHLVDRVVMSGLVPVILTYREDEGLPGRLGTLADRGVLSLIPLAPLGPGDTRTLLQQVLGGQVSVTTAALMHERSGGNPFYLRELVASGLETGSLREAEGLWTSLAPPAPSSDLVAVIRGRLDRLEERARQLLDVVALAEPVPLPVLERLELLGDVPELTAAGYLRGSGEPDGLVSTGHPLYGEVLRSSLDPERRRGCVVTLADAYDELGLTAANPERVATWRSEAGEADEELSIAAALASYARRNYDLAIAFADDAIAGGAGYAARTARAASLAETGRLDEAMTEFGNAADVAPDVRRRLWAVVGMAYYGAFRGGDVDGAIRRLEGAVAASGDRISQIDGRAWIAFLHATDGRTRVAADIADRVLRTCEARPRPTVVAAAALAVAAADGLDPDGMRRALEAGMAVVDDEAARRALPVAPDLLGATDVALVGARTSVSEALAECRARLAASVVDGTVDGPSIWAARLVALLVRSGRIEEAMVAGREAATTLQIADPLRLRPGVQVLRACAEAQSGNTISAERLLDGLEPSDERRPLLAPYVAGVRGLVAFDRGAGHEACDRLVVAGDEAAADDRRGAAAEVWYLAVRLGDPSPVLDRLQRVAETGGPVVGAWAQHAEASARRDRDGLLATSATLERLGMPLFAAESAAQASTLAGDDSDERGRRRALALADRLRAACAGADTPALRQVPRVRITPRERETAALASSGMTNRDIAERLSVSVRTVENHLRSVYQTLGAEGRHDLHRLLPVG